MGQFSAELPYDTNSDNLVVLSGFVCPNPSWSKTHCLHIFSFPVNGVNSIYVEL